MTLSVNINPIYHLLQALWSTERLRKIHIKERERHLLEMQADEIRPSLSADTSPTLCYMGTQGHATCMQHLSNTIKERTFGQAQAICT